MQRKYALAEGQVQGVGFRWFVWEQARRFGLTGYVRNLPDGTVEMELQGSPETLAFALQTIREGRRPIHVEQLTVSDLPVRPESGFQLT